MSDLFFCPERWEADPLLSSNTASQVQVRSYRDRTVEAWQLGDWEGSWNAITSQIPIEAGWLEAGCEYRFCFWLNGGENPKGDEVCSLEIYGDDWENRLTFPLNRNRTKPILEKNHWLLYAVPFTAPAAASALNFRFVAAGAVCTIAGIPDMDMASCEALMPDEPDTEHPCRHNIVYPHGWENQDEVVLKARGKEVSFSKRALRVAAALTAVTAVSLLAAYRHYQKKK